MLRAGDGHGHGKDEKEICTLLVLLDNTWKDTGNVNGKERSFLLLLLLWVFLFAFFFPLILLFLFVFVLCESECWELRLIM